MKKYSLLFVFAFFSCAKENRLHDKFRETVIAYQKKYPIPTDSQKSDTTHMYIYEATFYTKQNDTLFVLTRKHLRTRDFYDGYEIYQDRELQPLVVIDFFKLCGDFVSKEKDDMPKSFWWAGDSFDTQYTPLYRYKIKDKDFDLSAIDSVSQSRE